MASFDINIAPNIDCSAAAIDGFSRWDEKYLNRRVLHIVEAGRRRAEWLANQCRSGDVDELMRTLTRVVEGRLGQSIELRVTPVLSSWAIRRSWAGPFNLRHALAAMQGGRRSKWETALRYRGNFTRLLSLSISIGSSFTDADELYWNAVCSSSLTIDPDFATDWYRDLVASGLCEFN